MLANGYLNSGVTASRYRTYIHIFLHILLNNCVIIRKNYYTLLGFLNISLRNCVNAMSLFSSLRRQTTFSAANSFYFIRFFFFFDFIRLELPPNIFETYNNIVHNINRRQRPLMWSVQRVREIMHYS